MGGKGRLLRVGAVPLSFVAGLRYDREVVRDDGAGYLVGSSARNWSFHSFADDVMHPTAARRVGDIRSLSALVLFEPYAVEHRIYVPAA